MLKCLEDLSSYSNQLGVRQGLGVVYLNVSVPDMLCSLGAKKEKLDEKYRVKTLSLGVIGCDKYYELL